MQPGGVLRVAARITIKLPKKSELDHRGTATAGCVPRTVTCIATRNIGVDRVVAVAGRVRVGYHLTYFGKDGRTVVAAAGDSGVDRMAKVTGYPTHGAIATGVFSYRSGVVGIAVPRLP